MRIPMLLIVGCCRMLRPLVPLSERDPEKAISLFSTSGIVTGATVTPPVDFIDLRWILGFGITGSMLDEFSNLWTNPGSGRWLKFVEITRYSVETVSPLSNCVPKSSSYWPWMMLCYVADGICVQVWMAGWSSGTWTTWVMRWLGFAYDMRYSSFVQCFFKI